MLWAAIGDIAKRRRSECLHFGGRNHGSPMRFEREIIQRAVRILSDKANRCFDLAKSQRVSADRQNVNADGHEALARCERADADNERADAEKLAALGHSMEAAAAQLNGEIEMIEGRTSPILRTLPPDVPRGRLGPDN